MVEERNSRRKESPGLRPEGLRLQPAGTVVGSGRVWPRATLEGGPVPKELVAETR